MPENMTISAQSIWSSVNSSVLVSTRRTGQSPGSIAATVIRPRGGAGYFALVSSQVSRKFQNETFENFG